MVLSTDIPTQAEAFLQPLRAGERLRQMHTCCSCKPHLLILSLAVSFVSWVVFLASWPSSWALSWAFDCSSFTALARLVSAQQTTAACQRSSKEILKKASFGGALHSCFVTKPPAEDTPAHPVRLPTWHDIIR